MTGPRRLVGALSIASITMIGGVTSALVAPSVATASPAVASAVCGYPPGTCTVDFSSGTYRPGQKVHFVLKRHSFRPGEHVTGTLTGPHGRTWTFHFKAGPLGGLSGRFNLPKHLAKGTYSLGLAGMRSHKHIHGHLRVS